MFRRVDITCPPLEETRKRFLFVSEFSYVFFRSEFPFHAFPDFGRGTSAILLDVLQSAFLLEAQPQLAPIKREAALNFSILDRYEFEGSLVSVLLQGTCTEPVVESQEEARQTARNILEHILGTDNNLIAYRMDDPAWSALTDKATLSWAYFVYVSSKKLWWFVCFADDY